MALHKLERRNYSGKWLESIKYQNIHSFKEGLFVLCQSILETRRITHLHGSAPVTILLSYFCVFQRKIEHFHFGELSNENKDSTFIC